MSAEERKLRLDEQKFKLDEERLRLDKSFAKTWAPVIVGAAIPLCGGPYLPDERMFLTVPLAIRLPWTLRSIGVIGTMG